jgi:serine phosphatase RsbU (regulator of sigma subunit)
VREALDGWAAGADVAVHGITERLINDAVLLAGELVTSAVIRAGAEVEIACLLETGQDPDTSPQGAAPGSASAAPAGDRPVGVVVEVTDPLPSCEAGGRKDTPHDEPGDGLQLVRSMAESCGVTYRRAQKVVWFRLEGQEADSGARGLPDEGLRREMGGAEGLVPPPRRSLRGTAAGRADSMGPSFLAEASELLAGQLDEDMVAALAGQLLVPRFADWCGVWLSTDHNGLRLSRVWHADERRIGALRAALEKAPPPPGLDTRATSWPWPESPDAAGSGSGIALAIPLVADSRCQGVLLLGRAGPSWMADDVVQLMETLARRVAQAVATARQYTRQTIISRALQRRQLPTSLAEIPGIDTAVVYEPSGEGQTVGGDFYDLFPDGDGRWCFLLGDVCGSDPEAMSVTGLARHLVRLLAREGHDVALVLGRLNAALADGSLFTPSGSESAQSRFLSLLYGELKPDLDAGGAHCTIASAGHPLPLRLSADGSVTPVADPQILIGIDEDAQFHADSFDLAPGETLLCVTDGVTERRNGDRQLDDDDGLAAVMRGCTGLGAKAVAERVRSAVRDFGPDPVGDDLTVLVLEASPLQGAHRVGPQG